MELVNDDNDKMHRLKLDDI